MLLHFAPRATFSLANRATRAVLISHSLPSLPVKPPPRHTKFIVSKTELISLNFPWFANRPFFSPQTSSFERQSFQWKQRKMWRNIMLAKNNFFRGWNNFFVEHDTRCCAGRKFADYILNISIKPYIISKKKGSISIDLKLKIGGKC